MKTNEEDHFGYCVVAYDGYNRSSELPLRSQTCKNYIHSFVSTPGREIKMNEPSLVEDRDTIFAQPEYNSNDVEWLWETDYYDGPLAGIIEYHDQRYYAVWFDTFAHDYDNQDGEIETAERTIYCVYKLTEGRLTYEESCHSLFESKLDIEYVPPDLKTGKDGDIVGWFVY